MRKRLPLLIYLSVALAILLYASVRFMLGGPSPKMVELVSDINPADSREIAFISKNAGNLPKLPEKIRGEFPGVDHVSVRDNQDGSMSVVIRHKKIIGIWTDGTAYYQLAENGSPIMSRLQSKPAKGLVFKGHVPEDAVLIIRIVSASHELYKKIDHLEFIENRRWNIILAGGAVIMLPEQNAANAVGRIVSSGILGKKFSVLDMRDPKKMMVK